MRRSRVYVPLTDDQLRLLAQERRLVSPLEGYAPLATSRAETRSSAAGDEDAEYRAFEAAGAHAAALVGQGRRVIASLDAPDGALREVSTGPGAWTGVLIIEETPLRAFVSFHIDEAGDQAGEGEPDLLWYDVTELDAVLDELGLSASGA